MAGIGVAASITVSAAPAQAAPTTNEPLHAFEWFQDLFDPCQYTAVQKAYDISVVTNATQAFVQYKTTQAMDFGWRNVHDRSLAAPIGRREHDDDRLVLRVPPKALMGNGG